MTPNEIHRRVLELLDIPTFAVQSYTCEVGGKTVYTNGGVVPLAVPTLEALMLPLMDAMTTKDYGVATYIGDYGYGAALASWKGNKRGEWVKQPDDQATLSLAITTLFIAAVEAGLIDPKAVIL